MRGLLFDILKGMLIFNRHKSSVSEPDFVARDPGHLRVFSFFLPIVDEDQKMFLPPWRGAPSSVPLCHMVNLGLLSFRQTLT